MQALSATRIAFRLICEDPAYTHDRKEYVHETGEHQPGLEWLSKDLLLAFCARNLVHDKVEHRDQHGDVHGVVAYNHDVAADD